MMGYVEKTVTKYRVTRKTNEIPINFLDYIKQEVEKFQSVI